ncbi:helix-turn-helix domain-containing protein [Burkholderia vietnamiensis]|uniref:helix-turn-helix domain-containing protein n=1 Tax=Burkholderia vietnamiensis TaxID=60552 RepID=UPI000ABBD5B9|nr:helix-turn-helix domain-containing protein [Burkholderia vietnamiensis]
MTLEPSPRPLADVELADVDSNVTDWKTFVLTHGWRVPAPYVSAIVGRPERQVNALRSRHRMPACDAANPPKRFDELFSLWHGRPPRDAEWPIPRRFSIGYEWLAPELSLLARLTGQLSTAEIADTLTERLRRVTGDQAAGRSRSSVRLATNRIGLQCSDVVGGITPTEAGREIQSTLVVYQAIENGALKATRVGTRLVIARDDWDAWKATRTRPPEGYVRLSTIKQRLAIRSDKLSEFARMGYIDTAIRCQTFGTRGPSTQYGTWYVDARVAEQLVEDRRLGNPMPWHGKPIPDNLRATFKQWQRRKHPSTCETCSQIWGPGGPPVSFDDYAHRYPPLDHGAKRHLSRQWYPGLTIPGVARLCDCSVRTVERAIGAGVLAAEQVGHVIYIARSAATRWKARRCPIGDSQLSWLSVTAAAQAYGFEDAELEALIADGTFTSKVGEYGAMRGITYVLRQQCADHRRKNGYTLDEAAKKLRVSHDELRVLLDGVNWRGKTGVPADTIDAMRKRIKSRSGYSFEEAAALLGTSVAWIIEQRDKGIFRVLKTHWSDARPYLSTSMLERLRDALAQPQHPERLSEDWLRVGEAAVEAGVSVNTLTKWAEQGELDRRASSNGWRYHRDAVRARARAYWQTVRFHRAVPPDWVRCELGEGSLSHVSTGGSDSLVEIGTDTR